MKQPTFPLRSPLFIPGNQPDKMEKARSLETDVLILDLEDSVPLAEKVRARELVREALEGLVAPGRGLVVRINPLASDLAELDIEAVVGPGLDGISLPKVDSPQDIERAEALLAKAERQAGVSPGRTYLIPWIETAHSLLHAEEIARASPRILALAFGADDFTLDMGIIRSEEGTELFFPKALLAIAAQSAGVAALDGVYANFQDEDGLLDEARLARQLGYAGKFIFHPAQIEPVNRIFSPSPDDVDRARRIVAAFDAAVAKGVAVTVVDGDMVDTPVAERARRLLEWHQALEARRNL